MKRHVKAGYTLVEVIIAVTIAAVMVVAVQSATQAMTRAARQQTESSIDEARFQRLIEIVRRDLQGWIVLPENLAQGSFANSQTDALLLRIPSTADSLSAAISARPGQNHCRRSNADVCYVLRRSDKGFEIIRIERFAGEAPAQIRVWQGNQTPQFEFFQANHWLPEWTVKDRPAGVRITAGFNRAFLAL